ncbi:MAG: hypothetical protein P8075_20600 [Deltaproteobacteria bacterium]|jgi:hypothetical protein
MSDMSEAQVTEISVYVEDIAAKELVLECLPAEVRQRVRVVYCGSWGDVIRFLATFRQDPDLGNVVGILDGERVGKDAEHKGIYATFLGGSASEEDWTCLQERLQFLPGNVPPEAFIYQVGQEITYRSLVAAELNATPEMVGALFTSIAIEEAKRIPYELGRRVGLEKGRVLLGLAKTACVYRDGAFQPLRDFIHQRLEAGAR